MTGNEKLERELESFLKEDDSRVAALYRKLPQPSPDAKLDAAVLSMARAAVAKRSSRPRWLPALSAAAVVLLAVGVAYRVAPERWNERGELAKKSATTAETSAAPQSPPAVSPAPATAPAPRDDSDVKTSKQESAANVPAMAPRVQTEEAQPQRAKAMARMAAPRAEPAPAPVAKPSGALRSLDSQIFTPEPPSQAKAATSYDKLKDREALRQNAQPVEAAEAVVDEKATQQNLAAPVAVMSPAPPSVPPPAPAVAGAAMKADALSAEQHFYPEHWLDDIRQMLKDNRRDDALKNLAEFRKRYPNYHLPDDLRDLK